MFAHKPMYVSLSQARMLSAEFPIGDPFGGPAYGQKELIGLGIAAFSAFSTGAAVFAGTATLLQGLQFAGAAFTIIGKLTGDATLSNLGSMVGLAAGAAGGLKGLFEGAAGDIAGAASATDVASSSSPPPMPDTSALRDVATVAPITMTPPPTVTGVDAGGGILSPSSPYPPAGIDGADTPGPAADVSHINDGSNGDLGNDSAPSTIAALPVDQVKAMDATDSFSAQGAMSIPGTSGPMSSTSTLQDSPVSQANLDKVAPPGAPSGSGGILSGVNQVGTFMRENKELLNTLAGFIKGGRVSKADQALIEKYRADVERGKALTEMQREELAMVKQRAENAGSIGTVGTSRANNPGLLATNRGTFTPSVRPA